jgi:hypothetical protein
VIERLIVLVLEAPRRSVAVTVTATDRRGASSTRTVSLTITP